MIGKDGFLSFTELEATVYPIGYKSGGPLGSGNIFFDVNFSLPSETVPEDFVMLSIRIKQDIFALWLKNVTLNGKTVFDGVAIDSVNAPFQPNF